MLSRDMYQDNILEHYKNPHNYGELHGHNISYRDVNPLCGDIIEMHMIIESGKIKDVMFNGKGCVISQAAASMLTDEIKGKPIDEALKLEKEDILEMLYVEISPARQKCAFLSLKVMKMCLFIAKGKKKDV
jgi:nitrogen fixation protein NifU and related proteins